MEYIITFIFLFLGFTFGKLVLKQSSKNYNINLLIFAVVFFIFGSKTVVFGSSNFKVMLSDIIPSFLLGVLIRRYINIHLYKRYNS